MATLSPESLECLPSGDGATPMSLNLREILTVPERISERVLGKKHVFCLRSLERPVYVQAENEAEHSNPNA